MSMRVVLPDPFGPMSAVTVPGRASKLTSRTACTWPNDRAAPRTMIPPWWSGKALMKGALNGLGGDGVVGGVGGVGGGVMRPTLEPGWRRVRPPGG